MIEFIGIMKDGMNYLIILDGGHYAFKKSIQKNHIRYS